MCDTYIGCWKTRRSDGYGSHTIGYLGSIAILFSNGPAMLMLPSLFQSAGWFIPTLLMILMTVISSVASDALVESMAAVGKNYDLERRYEYPTLIEIYFPKQKWFFWLTVVLFNAALIALNIGSIITAAQSIDFLAAYLGWDGALQLYPKAGFVAVSSGGMASTPFGNDVIVISLGYMLILLLGGGLSFLNLDENVFLQTASFLFNILILGIWIVMWCMLGLEPSRIPFLTDHQAPVVGSIVFNYAFVLMIPSWANELTKGASVHGPVWWSTIIATVVFLLLGVFGGAALSFQRDEDLLGAMGSLPNLYPGFSALGKVTATLFPIVTVIPGIPIFSVLTRYSLMNSGFCSKNWANFWAIGIPYLITIPLYAGHGLASVINWTAILFNGSINFIIPFIIYLRMLQLRHYNLLHAIVPKSEIGDECCVEYEPIPDPKKGLQNDEEEKSRTLLLSSSDFIIPSSEQQQVLSPQQQDQIDRNAIQALQNVQFDEEENSQPTPRRRSNWLKHFRAFPPPFDRWMEPWIFGLILLVTMVVLNVLALALSFEQFICYLLGSSCQ